MSAPASEPENAQRSRRLIVVRHAKSQWPAGVPDFERPLGERGEADAPRMGEQIAGFASAIGLAVVSPARRTRQTWDLIAPRLGEVREVEFDDRIYQAWAPDLLALIRGIPADTASAVLVGHEPGLSGLIMRLAGAGGDPVLPPISDRFGNQHDRLQAVRVKFPTCAVAVLDSEHPWERFDHGCAQLNGFLTPRG